jgi:hypothetical protein
MGIRDITHIDVVPRSPLAGSSPRLGRRPVRVRSRARRARAEALLRLRAAGRRRDIEALSSHLGHADAGFTLRVHTHLMSSSEGTETIRAGSITPPARIVSLWVNPADLRLQVREVLAELERRDLGAVLLPLLLLVAQEVIRTSADLGSPW